MCHVGWFWLAPDHQSLHVRPWERALLLFGVPPLHSAVLEPDLHLRDAWIHQAGLTYRVWTTNACWFKNVKIFALENKTETLKTNIILQCKTLNFSRHSSWNLKDRERGVVHVFVWPVSLSSRGLWPVCCGLSCWCISVCGRFSPALVSVPQRTRLVARFPVETWSSALDSTVQTRRPLQDTNTTSVTVLLLLFWLLSLV